LTDKNSTIEKISTIRHLKQNLYQLKVNLPS